jgi:hypothetical protein
MTKLYLTQIHFFNFSQILLNRDANNKIPGAVCASVGVVAAPAGSTVGPTATVVAATVDWRTKGVVSPVKNQGQCGSCWAFTAIGALEAHNYIKTKTMVILSEQNLVDCTNGNTKNNSMYLSYGCNGGVTSRVFNFVRVSRSESTRSFSGESTGSILDCTIKKLRLKKQCPRVSNPRPLRFDIFDIQVLCCLHHSSIL